MSGWLRLWVLVSAIWLVIVVAFAALIAKDTFNDPDGPWIVYRLSDKAKGFYEGLEKNEKGPMFTVTFKYTDGETQQVRFPLLEKPIKDLELGKKLNKLAKEKGKMISPKVINKFLDDVAKSNKRAKLAKKEYESEVEKEHEKEITDRKNILKISLVSLIAPPIFLLLFGYGVAWVRKGFKNNA